MSFVFPLLLGGLLLAGVPILIHLIMRQKPKTLPFPAFRFLVQKHRTNVRKLRLRHLLLLALRMLLIAALCLALARPRLFHQGLGLNSERPVAAALLFDTSLSMEYRTSDKLSRLEDARKRGLELLNELPEGSRILVLETADGPQSLRGDWLTSLGQARDRIQALKVRPASTSVVQALEHAYRLLGQLARSREDETGRHLPRFLCVFSDRTRAAWDAARLGPAQAAADQVPPALEGLQQARGRIPSVIDALKELRAKLPPPPGRDYPEQALIDALEQLAPLIPSLTRASFPPDAELGALVESAQRRGRDLVTVLGPVDKGETNAEYRLGLVKNLQGLLGELRGVQALFVDVGLDAPVDLAITELEFPRQASGQPRQAFAGDEKIILKAVVRAAGKDFSTMLRLKLDKHTVQKEVALQAGGQDAVAFEIDAEALQLAPGFHHVEASLATGDLLPFNNQRFGAFLIRQPRQVLVVTPAPARAAFFVKALRALGFAADVKSPKEAPKHDMRPYQAVYLFQEPAPSAALWDFLASCAQQGLGVGVVPAGEEADPAAYNQVAAQRVLPGTLEEVATHGKDDGKTPGAVWDLRDNVLQHPLVSPFRNWKDYDVVRFPSQAFKFWRVKPREKDSLVVVPYRDVKDAPAVLERRLASEKGGGGKVLLFTTPLDDRTPRWNDYLEDRTVFYLVLVGLGTNYLAGATEEPALNFVLGQGEPLVALPLSARFPTYLVRGPDLLDQLPAPAQAAALKLKQADVPGNYLVQGIPAGGGEQKRVAAFSVNVPAEESDLTRVPVAEVEALLGAYAVAPADRQASLRQLLHGHWNEPLDLFPLLMVVILFVLVVENLLANKFYRRDQEAPEEARP